MNEALKSELLRIAEERTGLDDPAHDFTHSLRVLRMAELIAREECADLDVIVPAALFHDLVNYPKNSPLATLAPLHSAEQSRLILSGLEAYPREKIDLTCRAIELCSFGNDNATGFLEAMVLQDADRLEATGAIAIMRTFASSGIMQRPFYHLADPFCLGRPPEPLRYAIDLFYHRLLVVQHRMHTATGRRIARRRTTFVQSFLDELSDELEGK